jgi:hypothetical protein
VSRDVVDGAFLGCVHPVLDLGEGMLDRVEVGRIGRRVPKSGSDGL